MRLPDRMALEGLGTAPSPAACSTADSFGLGIGLGLGVAFSGRSCPSRDRFFAPKANAAAGQAAMRRSRQASRARRRANDEAEPASSRPARAAASPFTAAVTSAAHRAAEYSAGSNGMRVAAVRRAVAAAEAKEAEARESVRPENSSSDGDEDAPVIPLLPAAVASPSEVRASSSPPRAKPTASSANGRAAEMAARRPEPYSRAVVSPSALPEARAAAPPLLRVSSQPTAGRAAEAGAGVEVEVESRWPIVRLEYSAGAAAVPADPYPRYVRPSSNSRAARVGRFAVPTEAAAAAIAASVATARISDPVSGAL